MKSYLLKGKESIKLLKHLMNIYSCYFNSRRQIYTIVNRPEKIQSKPIEVIRNKKIFL